MNKILIYSFILLCISCFEAYSQQKITVGEYIEQYKDIAIAEMQKYKIPASITLAQGILESGCGNSRLAKEANNHFGIKCHKGWNGKTIYEDDDEKQECFRKYNKPVESYLDHSEFLTTRERYSLLFDYETTDYKNWAYGLKKAGYATNPRYPELLIKIIEENGLDKYDKGGSRQLIVDNHDAELKYENPELTFELVGRGGNDRPIFLNNGVKFILAREGDDFYKIASEFEIYTWQLFKYNDVDRQFEISGGQKVYLEKKKRKGKYDKHIVQQDENLHSISQEYGIRLKALCKYNYEKCGNNLEAGETLKLHR